MTANVIQGSFPDGQPRLAASIEAKAPMRPPGPPTPAFAARPPGPPAPAFAGRARAVQRHAAGAFAVEAGRLGLASGGGRPLPEALRGQMEAALGADFSHVRVHVGPQAERIGAIAFTVGSDIYFASGRYQPDTIQGRQLLGHELAHVVQQRAGRVRNPLGAGFAVVQDHGLEAEADRLGRRAAVHRVAAQAKMAPGAMQASPSVRISPPVKVGRGSYRLTAGAGGRPVGSVMVHASDKETVELTDLGVDENQRGHGIGRMLLASAAKTGRQFGKSKMTLAVQDKGSGHLTRWYKAMGFAQAGVNQRGYPRLEAPIGNVLASTAQRRMQTGTPHPTTPRGTGGQVRSAAQAMAIAFAKGKTEHTPQANMRTALGFARVVQRMDKELKTTAGHAEDFVILKNGFWLVKKVDRFEAGQYEQWTPWNKPLSVPDFQGPFDDLFELWRQRDVIGISDAEWSKISILDDSRGDGDRLLLLSNIGQGSGRRPIDLKLGFHTASGTDQKNRGEGIVSRRFKTWRHDVMDLAGTSRQFGVRDEGAHKAGKWGGDNLQDLIFRFSQSPTESLMQIKSDLETAKYWISSASTVYVGSSVLIDIDNAGRTGRARMIDFAHPICKGRDASFSEHQKGILTGLNTVIGFLEAQIEQNRRTAAMQVVPRASSAIDIPSGAGEPRRSSLPEPSSPIPISDPSSRRSGGPNAVSGSSPLRRSFSFSDLFESG